MRFFTILIFSALSIFACSVNKIENSKQVTNSVNQTNSSPSNDLTKEKPKDFLITDTSIPVLKPSNLIEELRKRIVEKPEITAKDLADYGNLILQKYGYDYTFDWKPKGKENEENLTKTGDDYYPFFYRFTDSSGKSKKFQLLNDHFEHPCFSVIDIPITKVNEKTVTVVSDGKEIELKLTKDFYLEEFALLDKDLKKTVRKWKTPIDAMPVGISEDGKRIYFDSWEFYQDETDGYKEAEIHLAVEISEDGSLKLVDKNEIKSGAGEDFDYDKQYPEINYKKYKIGNNEYNVKYSAPCS